MLRGSIAGVGDSHTSDGHFEELKNKRKYVMFTHLYLLLEEDFRIKSVPALAHVVPGCMQFPGAL